MILRVETVACPVCLAPGSDIVANDDGADRIHAILRDYLAPEAVESGKLEVVPSLQFKQTDQTMDVYPAEFDWLPRKAESKMHLGGGLPESSLSVLCIRSAALSRKEKSLESASVKGGLGITDVAKQTGRLFGPCSGGVVRMHWRLRMWSRPR